MREHIAEKNGRYYPVISRKYSATGKWERKWLSGHKAKRESDLLLWWVRQYANSEKLHVLLKSDFKTSYKDRMISTYPEEFTVAPFILS
jgi:hypothetical protein